MALKVEEGTNLSQWLSDIAYQTTELEEAAQLNDWRRDEKQYFFDVISTSRMTAKYLVEEQASLWDVAGHMAHITTLVDGLHHRQSAPIEDGSRLQGLLREFKGWIDQARIEVERLLELERLASPEIPQQELAPFQFGFTGNQLDIVVSPSRPLLDAAPIEAAKRFLLEQAEQLNSTLTNSPQVATGLRSVTKYLASGQSIVALGMAAEAFSRVAEASRDELGGARMAALLNFAEEVDRFASQFDEWRTYVENAAQTRYGNDEIAGVLSALDNIAQGLKQNPGLATERATEAIFEASASSSKSLTGKQKLGAVRTLGNLILALAKRVGNEVVTLTVSGGFIWLVQLVVAAATKAPLLIALPWVGPVLSWLQKLYL